LGESARPLAANGVPEPRGLFPHPVLRTTFSHNGEKEIQCGQGPRLLEGS